MARGWGCGGGTCDGADEFARKLLITRSRERDSGMIDQIRGVKKKKLLASRWEFQFTMFIFLHIL